MYCSQCGAKIHKDSKYCYECGYKIVVQQPKINKEEKHKPNKVQKPYVFNPEKINRLKIISIMIIVSLCLYLIMCLILNIYGVINYGIPTELGITISVFGYISLLSWIVFCIIAAVLSRYLRKSLFYKLSFALCPSVFALSIILVMIIVFANSGHLASDSGTMAAIIIFGILNLLAVIYSIIVSGLTIHKTSKELKK